MKTVQQSILIAFLLLVKCSLEPCFAQEVNDCPRVRLSFSLDSTQVRNSLDSVAQLASGHWRLVEITEGRRPRPLLEQVEMFLDIRGEGFITDKGSKVTSCKFTFSAPYAYIRFRLDEESRSYFRFRTDRRGEFKGGFRVCEKKLVLYNYKSETLAYVFDRVK